MGPAPSTYFPRERIKNRLKYEVWTEQEPTVEILDGKNLLRDPKYADFKMKTIEEEEAFVQTQYHLSTFPSREEWEQGGPKSVGELINCLWKTKEIQWLYMKNMWDRVKALESQ